MVSVVGSFAQTNPAITPECGKTGEVIDFTLENVTSGNSYTIDFGDGNTTTIVASAATTVSHTYVADGDYSVSITDVAASLTYNQVVKVRTLDLGEDRSTQRSFCLAEPDGFLSVECYINGIETSFYSGFISGEAVLGNYDNYNVIAYVTSGCYIQDDITIYNENFTSNCHYAASFLQGDIFNGTVVLVPNTRLLIDLENDGNFEYDFNTYSEIENTEINYTFNLEDIGLYQARFIVMDQTCDEYISPGVTSSSDLRVVPEIPVVDLGKDIIYTGTPVTLTASDIENSENPQSYYSYYWSDFPFTQSWNGVNTLTIDVPKKYEVRLKIIDAPNLSHLYSNGAGTIPSVYKSEMNLFNPPTLTPECAQLNSEQQYSIGNFSEYSAAESPISFRISYDDGSPDEITTDGNFAHTFTTAGDHVITLTGVQNGEDIGTVERTVTVYDIDLGDDTYLLTSDISAYRVNRFSDICFPDFSEFENITWFHDGEEIIMESPYSASSSGQYSVLVEEGSCIMEDEINIVEFEVSNPFPYHLGCNRPGDVLDINLEFAPDMIVQVSGTGYNFSYETTVDNNTETFQISYPNEGFYNMTLTARHKSCSEGGRANNVAQTRILNPDPYIEIPEESIFLNGSEVELLGENYSNYPESVSSSSFAEYRWKKDDVEVECYGPDYIVSEPGDYTLYMQVNPQAYFYSASNGTIPCLYSDNVEVYNPSVQIINDICSEKDVPVYFTVEIDGYDSPYESITWDFGDGSIPYTTTDNTEIFSHIYDSNIDYTVNVTVTILGHTFSASKVVQIGRTPQLALEVDKRWCSGMYDPPVITATEGYDYYEWQMLGDDNINTITNNSFVANAIGIYEVRAFAGTCMITNTIEVEEFRADFQMPPCLTIREEFDANSLAHDATNFEWDFGQSFNDNSSVCNQNASRVSCTYYEPEYYYVCHTASNAQCSDVSCKPVNVGMSPEADFIKLDNLCVNGRAEFRSQSTGEDNRQFEWTFTDADGDNVELYGSEVEYFSSTAGNVDVELVVTNACNRSHSATHSYTISPNVTAGIGFLDGINTACPGYPVVCIPAEQTNTAITDLEFTWTADDGTTQTTNTADQFSHSFTEYGNHTVRLDVSNDGCSNSITRSVFIHPEAEARLYVNREQVSSYQACPGEFPQLAIGIENYDQSLDYTYIWKKDGVVIDFGGEDVSPIYNVSQAGTYSAYINVNCGEQYVGSVVIEYVTFSEPQFTTYAETCPGEGNGHVDLSFSDELRSLFGLVDFYWNTPTSTNVGLPGGTYSVRAEYQISGCSQIYSFTIPTNSLAIDDIIVQPSSCNGNANGSITILADASYSYSWSHNPGLSSNTATNLAIGDYAVTVSNSECSVTENIRIDAPMIYANIHASSSCGDGARGRAAALVKSSRGELFDDSEFRFEWTREGETTPLETTTTLLWPLQDVSIAMLPLGSYTLKIFDEVHGCESNPMPLTITQGDAPSVTIQKEPASCGESSGKLSAIVTNATIPIQYNWNGITSNNMDVVENLYPGDYDLTITDARGCTATASAVINESVPLSISFQPTAGNCGASVNFTGNPDSQYEIHWQRYEPTFNFGLGFTFGTNVEKISRNVSPGTVTEIDLTPGLYMATVYDMSSEECYAETEQATVVGAPRQDFNLNVALRFKRPSITEDPETATPEPDPNTMTIRDRAIEQMYDQIESCHISMVNDIEQSYSSVWSTLGANEDILSVSMVDDRYQFTLYYYDRAGNLVRTVAPEGVNYTAPNNRTAEMGHTFETEYEYNSLNQLIKQTTPDGSGSDGNITHFVYNDNGQLRFSQNEKQAANGVYSYTKYDYLGRIIEVGESSQDIATVQSYLTDHFVAEAQNSTSLQFPDDENSKSYVTHTVYSQAAEVDYFGQSQRHLLNRVSYSYVDPSPAAADDESFTYYSYDPHGNVEWLVQDVPGFVRTYVAYEYDLVSGNVLKVKYNEQRPDRFYHRYAYDADNRLEKVETSRDGVIWDVDANYQYYKHGPLKRVEIGNDKIQGVDYVYNLQGWLKAVNHPDCTPTNDPGRDGVGGNPFPSDVFGMSLGYHDKDFRSNGGNNPYANTNTPVSGVTNLNLYNGNISSWAYQVKGEDVFEQNSDYLRNKMVRKDFNYDQLNRIVHSDMSVNNGGVWSAVAQGQGLYASTSYDYDKNGNLTNLRRYEGTKTLDDFQYSYSGNTNMLTSITEQTSIAINPEDGMFGDIYNGSGADATNTSDADCRYTYDEIGNLIEDISYERTHDVDNNTWINTKVVRNIEWNPYGKVSSVSVQKNNLDNGNSFMSRHILNFAYDATGNRISKEVKYFDNANNEDLSQNKKEFYLRDASGNILSVYNRKLELQGDGKYTVVFNVKEVPLYGSDRLGMSYENEELYRIMNIDPEVVDDVSFDISGIEINNSLYHWITPKYKPVELDADNTFCNCALEQLMYTENTGTADDNSYVNSIKMQFMGRADNNIVVAEENSHLRFYAVTAQSYLGNENVTLMLDHHGNLMKGSNGILSEHQAKGLALQSTSNDDLWYLITIKDQQAYYTQVDMSAQGYGTSIEDPSGEVTDLKNVPLTPSGEKIGRHIAAIEDREHDRLLLYMLRYNEPVAANTLGTVDILAYEIPHNDFTNATEHLLAQVEGLDEYGDGELQVSPDGNYISLFNRRLRIGGFEHRDVEMVAMQLMPDRISVDISTLERIHTMPGGAYGKASTAFAQDPASGEIYQMAQQQSTVMLGGDTPTDKPFWRRLFNGPFTQQFVQNEDIQQKGDIRQGRTMQVYVPGAGNQDEIATTDFGGLGSGTHNLSTTLSGYMLAGGLPGQVLKINGSGANEHNFVRTVGLKRYELKDHLGNVRAVVTDNKFASSTGFDAQVASVSDYYPFGMPMPNRSGQNDRLYNDKYRFGFQGQEEDVETGFVNYKYRMHDPRIGRFFAVDPLAPKYPHNSPYAFSENRVIDCIELEGLEKFNITNDNAFSEAANKGAFDVYQTNEDGSFKTDDNGDYMFDDQKLENSRQVLYDMYKNGSGVNLEIPRKGDYLEVADFDQSTGDITTLFNANTPKAKGSSYTPMTSNYESKADEWFGENIGRPAGRILMSANVGYNTGSIIYMLATDKVADGSGRTATAKDYTITSLSIVFSVAGEGAGLLQLSNSSSVGLEATKQVAKINGYVVNGESATEILIEEWKK